MTTWQLMFSTRRWFPEHLDGQPDDVCARIEAMSREMAKREYRTDAMTDQIDVYYVDRYGRNGRRVATYMVM